MKILIVEDNAVLAKKISDWLAQKREKRGHPYSDRTLQLD